MNPGTASRSSLWHNRSIDQNIYLAPCCYKHWWHTCTYSAFV